MRIVNVIVISLLLPASVCFGRAPSEPTDLTQPHGVWRFAGWQFNLGPTGMTGFFPGKENNSNQIQVRDVFKGGPAFGKIRPGDIILGVNGTPLSEVKGSRFAYLGNLIDEAETEAQGADLLFDLAR